MQLSVRWSSFFRMAAAFFLTTWSLSGASRSWFELIIFKLQKIDRQRFNSIRSYRIVCVRTRVIISHFGVDKIGLLKYNLTKTPTLRWKWKWQPAAILAMMITSSRNGGSGFGGDFFGIFSGLRLCCCNGRKMSKQCLTRVAKDTNFLTGSLQQKNAANSIHFYFAIGQSRFWSKIVTHECCCARLRNATVFLDDKVNTQKMLQSVCNERKRKIRSQMRKAEGEEEQ